MHLLLIEDDEVIARELAARWRQRDMHVEIAATLAQADRLLSDAVDLVVLDLGLPDGDGLGWLARLRHGDAARTLPVLVLTARDRVADRVRGLQTGADDYLVKPFAPEELDARVGALARRLQQQRGDALRFGELVWYGQEGRALLAGRPLQLSPREFEVLGMLVERAPRLVRKDVLVGWLAERNVELGDSAVEVYISRLRRKLADSGLEIRTLRGFGYLLARAGSADGAGS